MRKSFVLYTDSLEVIEELSDKETKNLLRAIIAHAKGEEIQLSTLERIAFLPIKNYLDRDARDWEEVRIKRAEYGKRGGLAKASKSYQKLPKAKQKVANVAVNDIVNVNVTDTVNVIDTNKEINTNPHVGKPDKTPATIKKTSYEKFVDLFNELTGRSFRYGDTKAQRQFRVLLQEGYTRDDIAMAIKACKKDPHHKDTSFKYLTPEFITRISIFERYLNIGKAEAEKYEEKKSPKAEFATEEDMKQVGDLINNLYQKI